MATLAKLASVDIEEVSGFAGKRGAALRAGGIRTVADLLVHVPRRYIDRSRVEPIATLPTNEEVTIIGTIRSISTRRPRRRLDITEASVHDGSATIKVVWFNQSFRQRQLPVGTEVALSGKVETFKGSYQMKTPEVDILSGDAESLTTGRVVPVYRNVRDVGIGYIRRGVHNALKRSLPMPDVVPESILNRHDLAGREQAFTDIHFPELPEAVGPARRRLVFDELFRLEVALAMAKHRQIDDSAGIVHRPTGVLVDRFLRGLPYDLTEAQRRALQRIDADLRRPHPMHRLLQGDVGSGKTVVAVAALLVGVEGGHQGALMAPTEVLAVQHYLGITDLVDRAGLAPHGSGSVDEPSLFDDPEAPAVRVVLLTGSQAEANFASASTRRQVADWIADGTADIVIGTHALIQESVDFSGLGVAVVDEQHRFGALQRQDLKAKGQTADPDLLIMTATPIPRTLSMTFYGDLDQTIIDELPPGRTPIRTVTMSRADEDVVWDVVRDAVGAGRQAFVVCPLVDESEKVEAASATEEHRRLSALLPDLRVGLLHGQLSPADKEAVMASFREGSVDVLVATTVIEVGVDVPNATVMVIEDADRFGLSQLHQLRGRVGRGVHPGTCVLLADPSTPDGEERLAAMVRSTDGFELAEVDLRLRGTGTVFGARQSGMADLRLANILDDGPILEVAREEAFSLVDGDPRLVDHPDLAAEVRALLGDRVDWLFVS